MFFHVKTKHQKAISQAIASGIPMESLFLEPNDGKNSAITNEVKEDSDSINLGLKNENEINPEFEMENSEKTNNDKELTDVRFKCEICDIAILREGVYTKHVKTCRYYARCSNSEENIS